MWVQDQSVYLQAIHVDNLKGGSWREVAYYIISKIEPLDIGFNLRSVKSLTKVASLSKMAAKKIMDTVAYKVINTSEVIFWARVDKMLSSSYAFQKYYYHSKHVYICFFLLLH